MSEDEFVCARNGCNAIGVRKTHNQKYCTDECCRLATNTRIMEKYYERQDQRNGKTRFCKVCLTTKLSRYNDGQVCSSCKTKREVAANAAVADMFSRASLAI